MKRMWKFLLGIILTPEDTDPTTEIEGSVWSNGTDKKLRTYLDSAVREVTTNDQTQTLKNKNIDGTNGNVISNIAFDVTDTPLSSTIHEDAIKEGNYVQQADRSAFLRCPTEILWTGSVLVFEDDLVLEIINGEDRHTTTYTIDVSTHAYQIGLTGDEFLYLDIDRSSTSLNIIPKISTGFLPQSEDVFILFKRVVENGVANLYLPFSKQFVSEGQSFKIGASGGGSGLGVKVKVYDPVNLVLPSVDPVVIDGVTIVNDDLVLFSNLTVEPNRIYKASVSGGTVFWFPQRVFNNSNDPSSGDAVIIEDGTIFKNQTTMFDGTNFKINDVVRYFDGVGTNFYEVSSIKRTNITALSTNNVFTVALAGSENMIIDYSLLIGTGKETGQLYITSDGTNVSISRNTAFLNNTDVLFEAIKNVNDLELNYTSSNASDGVMRYSVKRWSNNEGGTTGLPSYNSGAASSTPAAGNVNEVQYKGADGNLAASDKFVWDGTKSAINLNGLNLHGLSQAITLNDAQVTPAVVLNYGASNKFTVLEYSIERGSDTRMGRLLIPTNGTTINFSDDYVETNVMGITLNVVLNGANVELQYTSTSTGNTGTFKYSFRQWN